MDISSPFNGRYVDLVQLRWSISALARAASIISLLPEFRPARSGRPVEVREEGKRLGDAQSDEPRRSRPSVPSAQLPILDLRLGDSRDPTDGHSKLALSLSGEAGPWRDVDAYPGSGVWVGGPTRWRIKSWTCTFFSFSFFEVAAMWSSL